MTTIMLDTPRYRIEHQPGLREFCYAVDHKIDLPTGHIRLDTLSWCRSYSEPIDCIRYHRTAASQPGREG